MIRKIIQIDRDACNGCGLCVGACHEGAIGLVNGKAQLLRDDYCDGLGDCLPVCPTGAITFAEREAAAYDHNAVLAAKASRLENWPVQIKLAPIRSPMLDGEKLLIAATCSAYACGSFHRDFIDGHKVLVGCPKLDGVDYAVKLGEILKHNNILSVTVVRMEVPCCGGLEFAAKRAIEISGKEIPLSVVTLSTDGRILD